MSPATPHDRLLPSFPQAKQHWMMRDPVLADLATHHPPEALPLEMEKTPFAFLVQSITHQQVSLAAGATIFGRLQERLGSIDPPAVLEAGEEALGGCGLSRQKCGYVLDLATRLQEDQLQFHRLPELEIEDAIAELTRVRGIGDWSAKMYLMFFEQRPDVPCHEDLGLRLAVQKFYDVPEKEVRSWMRKQAAAWSPYNTLAARVLWHARRV